MHDRLAYGDVVVQLEAAALAVGRLDTALSGHPLLPAWTFWSQLDTARRHAEVDGCRVDLYRLAAFLHGLPLRVGGVLHGCTRLSQTNSAKTARYPANDFASQSCLGEM
jgi:hypothetical protein